LEACVSAQAVLIILMKYRVLMNPDHLDAIIERITARTQTVADVEAIRTALSDRTQDLQQLGKYNIHIEQGQNIYIGDRIYSAWTDEAIQALIQTIQAAQENTNPEKHLRFEEQCGDRRALNQYVQATLDRLKHHGCYSIQQDVTSDSRTFNYVAKISDFEFPFGPLRSRGEAFFLFSEFSSVTIPILQRFSGQCLQWARKQADPKAAGQAFYNFRVPTHLCFAIALVDQLDPEMRSLIRCNNPIGHRVDLLWYEIPVVYELSQQTLYFYDQPSNIFELFKGEIVWKQLRQVIQKLLVPTPAKRVRRT
jgi:hypothetical protein